jgi:hypothetical protein
MEMVAEFMETVETFTLPIISFMEILQVITVEELIYIEEV